MPGTTREWIEQLRLESLMRTPRRGLRPSVWRLLAVAVLALLLAVLAAGAARASLSSDSSARVTGGLSLCQLVNSLKKSGLNLPTATPVTAGARKIMISNFKAIEPLYLADSPPSLQPDFQKYFGLFNALIAESAKYNYDAKKIPLLWDLSVLPRLEAAATPAGIAIAAYFKNVCHIKSG